MKTLYKFKVHQLVHLLQIQYVNVFYEMQQLRLRRWNFIKEIRGKLTKFSENLTPKIYLTHQLRFILEQYYQLSIVSYDHFIVFCNWF